MLDVTGLTVSYGHIEAVLLPSAQLDHDELRAVVLQAGIGLLVDEVP